MEPTDEWLYQIDLASQPASASEARAFVARHLRDGGLDALVSDAELVVSELVTNAMVHAETAFKVTLGAQGDAIRLEVHDGSRDAPVLKNARALDTGGRGVAIVEALTRDWGVSPTPAGGKSVWAEFDLTG